MPTEMPTDIESIRPQIEKLHDTPHKTALAVSGAGTQAVAWLLGVSGASRTILEVVVPYGRLAMQDYLGFEPTQSASADTARQLARRAYDRARAQREDASPAVGLACAAAIATDRPRRGEHRAFIAACDAASNALWSLTFHKGRRDRPGEETAVSRLIILALAEFSGLQPANPEQIAAALHLTPNDSLHIERTPHPDPLERLLAGEIRWVTRRPAAPDDIGGPDAIPGAIPEITPGIIPDANPGVIPGVTPEINPGAIPDTTPGAIPGVTHDGTPEITPGGTPEITPGGTPETTPGGITPGIIMEAEGAIPPALLPGSFNPLHLGHREMLAAAARHTGQPAAYELSVTNVDKPPLPLAEIRRRLAQFAPGDTIILTRAAAFRQKAALFPGATFIMGWDTAARLVAPRYYGGEPPMLLALAQMMASGAKFLVAGRLDSPETGRPPVFRTLVDVPAPAGFAPMFAEIPEPLFRRDISSTQLRQTPPPPPP